MNLKKSLQLLLPGYVKTPEQAVEALETLAEYCGEQGWNVLHETLVSALEHLNRSTTDASAG